MTNPLSPPDSVKKSDTGLDLDMAENDRHHDEEVMEEVMAVIIHLIVEAIVTDRATMAVLFDEMTDEMIDIPPEETMKTIEERLSGVAGEEEATTDPGLELDAAETTEIN